MRMTKKLALVLSNAWFFAYAGWEVFSLTHWDFHWWNSIFWIPVCLAWVLSIRAIVLASRNPVVEESTTWLTESASWPEPWSRHDLDQPELKGLP